MKLKIPKGGTIPKLKIVYKLILVKIKFMTEGQFSKKVKFYLEEKLKQKGYCSTKISERANILNNLTVGRIKSEWKIVFGFLEQDIILYQDVIDVTELRSDKVFIPRGTKDKKIIIPLAICELKIGKNINTHQFITYGSIAREIRSIFPHCAYYFVSGDKKREFSEATLLRHTKEFDRVYLNWEKDKRKILDDLIQHLNYLKKLEII